MSLEILFLAMKKEFWSKIIFLMLISAIPGTTGLEGGLATNYKAAAAGTNLTINTATNNVNFTAVAGANRPKVVADTASGIPAATFSANDIVQIAGTTNAENDGLYVVQTNGVAGTLEFKINRNHFTRHN